MSRFKPMSVTTDPAFARAGPVGDNERRAGGKRSSNSADQAPWRAVSGTTGTVVATRDRTRLETCPQTLPPRPGCNGYKRRTSRSHRFPSPARSCIGVNGSVPPGGYGAFAGSSHACGRCDVAPTRAVVWVVPIVRRRPAVPMNCPRPGEVSTQVRPTSTGHHEDWSTRPEANP